MPRKVRELKRDLKRAGFRLLKQRGKGSHTVWTHPNVPDDVVLSGADGDDAFEYQEKHVQRAIAMSRRSFAAKEK
jgi:predicted RNA binding protein YcfA (HicA-like mRNA interferase family)